MARAARLACALGALLLAASEEGADANFLRKAPTPAANSSEPLPGSLEAQLRQKRKLQANWDFVSGSLTLIGHLHATGSGGQDSGSSLLPYLQRVVEDTIEELTDETVRRTDIQERAAPTAVKCADFQNYGQMKQYGFESKITGAWFSIGWLGGPEEASCEEDAESMTIRLVSQPIGLNTGGIGACQFLHPQNSLVQNLAHALGYNYADVLESMRDARGCRIMALDACGLTQSATGNVQYEHPMAIKFRAKSTRKLVEMNYQISAPVGTPYIPMQVLAESGEPPGGNGRLRDLLTSKMSQTREIQHWNTINWCVKTDRYWVGPTSTTTLVGDALAPECADGTIAGPYGCATSAPAVTTTTFCKPWELGCITQTTTTLPACTGSGGGCQLDPSRADCNAGSSDLSCWIRTTTTTAQGLCTGSGPGCMYICMVEWGGCRWKHINELEGTTTTALVVEADSILAEGWFWALLLFGLSSSCLVIGVTCWYVQRSAPTSPNKKKLDQKVVVHTGWGGAQEVTEQNIAQVLGGNPGPRMAAIHSGSRAGSPAGSRAVSREVSREPSETGHSPGVPISRGNSPSRDPHHADPHHPAPHDRGSHHGSPHHVALTIPGAGGSSRPSPMAGRGRSPSPARSPRGDPQQHSLEEVMRMANQSALHQSHLLQARAASPGRGRAVSPRPPAHHDQHGQHGHMGHHGDSLALPEGPGPLRAPSRGHSPRPNAPPAHHDQHGHHGGGLAPPQSSHAGQGGGHSPRPNAASPRPGGRSPRPN